MGLDHMSRRKWCGEISQINQSLNPSKKEYFGDEGFKVEKRKAFRQDGNGLELERLMEYGVYDGRFGEYFCPELWKESGGEF